MPSRVFEGGGLTNTKDYHSGNDRKSQYQYSFQSQYPEVLTTVFFTPSSKYADSDGDGDSDVDVDRFECPLP